MIGILNTILDYKFLNNTVLNYIIFIALIVAGIILIRLGRKYFYITLSLWASARKEQLESFLRPLLRKTLMPLLYTAVVYFSLKYLEIPKNIETVINIIWIIILTIQGIRFFSYILEFLLKEIWLKSDNEDHERKFKGIIPAFKVGAWALGILFLLDNLGVNINTALAGLGIGGVAAAIASQAILKDLFSYVAIIFDRPFEIGDFIIVGEYLGVVENIGIKTTRIRSLTGEQIVFSNTDLTDSRVRNYMRMEKRRVDFKIGIEYESSVENIKAVPTVIKGIIESIENTEFDRAHFFKFGDYNLIYEVIYYVLSSDYTIFMDIQQEINFKIIEAFKDRDIHFAYPTEKHLLLQKNKGQSMMDS